VTHRGPCPPLPCWDSVKTECRICVVQRSSRGGRNPCIRMPSLQPEATSAFQLNPLFLGPYPDFPALSSPASHLPCEPSIFFCPSLVEMLPDGPSGSGMSNPTRRRTWAAWTCGFLLVPTTHPGLNIPPDAK